MSVVRLVEKTQDARHWSAKDVLEAALKDVEQGKIGPNDRLMVISVGPRDSGEFDTHFLQTGLRASEMVMLLEIVKMDIYRKHMAS